MVRADAGYKKDDEFNAAAQGQAGLAACAVQTGNAAGSVFPDEIRGQLYSGIKRKAGAADPAD